MATSLPTYSAFSLNNRPSVVEYNRNGAVNLSGSALPPVCGQHWIPSIDNTFDLGQNSTPLRWRDLWLSRNASVVGTTTTGALTVSNNAVFTNGPLFVGPGGIQNYNGSTPNIGTTLGRFGTGYFTNLNVQDAVTAGGLVTCASLFVTTAQSVFGNTIRPSAVGVFDIGTAALPWRDIYITGNIYKNGVLYSTGGGLPAGDLLPAADNVYKIGNSTNRWKEIWVSDTGFINRVLATANVETATGDLVATNGSLHVGGGISTGEAGIGLGNINLNGSLVMLGSYQMSPNVTNQGSLGATAKYWNDLYTLNGHINILSPNGAGTPVTSTWVGTALSQYENAYIQNINSRTIVPFTNNTGSVGTSALRYAEGFYTDLNISNMPSCPWLVGASFAPTFLGFTTTPGAYAPTYTVAVNDMTYMRVGHIYTVAFTWSIQPSAGHTPGTVFNDFWIAFTLPTTMSDTIRSGIAVGGDTDDPDFHGSVAYQGASSFKMVFNNITLPTLTGGYFQFRCIFQCRKTTA